ncbi:DUF4129 domain-containing protein [Haladaptatus sp. CMAA 1911]|uniref:DUF4129 domain-containing protein n=1 Tax=unclassified Haladaptatus TaxID=2622732 RepID=UPI003754183C
MERDTARTIVIALLCILAIAFAAATLNSAVSEDGSGTGLGGGPGGVGSSRTNSSAPQVAGNGGPSMPFQMPCYPVLDTAPAILLILGAFLLLVGIAYRKAGGLGAFAVIGPVGIPVLLLHALLTACTVSPLQRDGGLMGEFNRSDLSLPQGGTGGLGDGAKTMSPSILMFLVLGIALVGAVVLLVRSSSGSEEDTPEADALEESEEDIAAVGRAAGEAADRIESESSVENEVYRAWSEMTQYLHVPSPESSTPGEFAAAAVDAGMDPEDVSELTGVFEEVRYGGHEANDEHEERAIAALRRIERTYAGDE